MNKRLMSLDPERDKIYADAWCRERKHKNLIRLAVFILLLLLLAMMFRY